MTNNSNKVNFKFPLEIEDDWPPVPVESLPFDIKPNGYELLTPPLFVKELSVGDIIEVTLDPVNENVLSWQYIKKSKRTTIWLLQMEKSDTVEPVLEKLRKLGCNTSGIKKIGINSIDLPESISID
jgi:hypothetical protein